MRAQCAFRATDLKEEAPEKRESKEEFGKYGKKRIKLHQAQVKAAQKRG